MVGLAFVEDEGDSTAVLVVKLLDGERVVFEESVLGAAHERQGNLGLG